MKNATNAFTLAELMIITAIIGLIVAIAIPNFANARKAATTNSCKANLRQLQGAVISYSVDKGVNPESLANLKPDYMKIIPNCPSQPSNEISYAYNMSSGNVTCAVDPANHAL